MRAKNLQQEQGEPSQWQKARMTRMQRLAKAQLQAASAGVVAQLPDRARWYCLALEGGREATVEHHLTQAGVENFLAKERWVAIRKGQKIEGERPMMPGYILVRVVPSNEAFHGLRQQKFVRAFVGNDAGYHVVSDRDVAVIKGISLGGEINRMPVDRSIGEGSAVEIAHGPFAGFKAVVVQVTSGRSPRARLWVEAFGSQREISSIPLALLKKL